MKRLGVVLSIMIALYNPLLSQSEAGAIFLLIAPGARAGGRDPRGHSAPAPAHAPLARTSPCRRARRARAPRRHVRNCRESIAQGVTYEVHPIRRPERIR